MKYVVAYSADSGGRAALDVARLFAAPNLTLTVCTITPATWGYPSMAAVDAEYAEFLRAHAAKALDDARAQLGDDVDAEYLARAARSPTDGLLELVAELDAGMVILGSARGGPLGRFAMGSVTSSLLHAAPVPVALAPRHYRSGRRTRVSRVSCGYIGPGPSEATLAAATDLALRHDVPLRLITGVVRDRQMYPSLVGYDAERQVQEQWRSEAEHGLALAMDQVSVEVTAEIVTGPGWDDALDAVHWEEGEVLVIGSSRLGIGRIFLGTNASKIVRSAPVPTLVVPGPAGAA